MEVLRINGRIAGIQIGSLQQALNDQRDICVERLFDLFQCNDLFQHRTIEQEGDDRSPFQSDLRCCDQCSINIANQSVDAVLVSSVTVECDNALHQLSHFPYILSM